MRYKVFEGRQVIGLLAILFCFTNLVYSQSDTTTTTTITPTTTPGDNNPALKLIIIIVIPTLAITVICIVCVVIGVRKTRNSGRKWWKIYGNGRQPTASQLENADPQAKLEFSIQQMNHYMDIKAMADQFKNDKWEIKGKDLLVHDDCLGNGAFACVFRGTLKGKIPLFKVYASLQLVLEHTTGETSEVAVKKLPAHANHEGRVDFFHEMSFMKRLGYHPHVISMLGCVSNPIDPLIVVEYCKHGDLLRFLRKNKGSILKDETPKESKENDYPDYEVPMKIKDLVSIAWQVCDGLCYLSSHKFIHRDVAARNILLTKGMCAKISDFGLCRYADSSLYTAKGGRLPIKWMAPESLKFYEYTEKTEVWSYGIMLHEMFSLGEAPYPSVQPMEMIQYLEEGNRMRQPVKCPNEMYILMKGAWEFKGEDRPTFDELRAKISMLLNLGDEQYGYLSLPTSSGPTSPSGVTQLTFQDDQCALTDEMLGRQPKGPTDGPEEEGERKLSENPQFDMAKLVEMKMAWKKKKKAINEKLQIHVEIDEANDKAIISRELLDKMRQLTADCDNMEFRMPPESPDISTTKNETQAEIHSHSHHHHHHSITPTSSHDYANLKKKSLDIPESPTRREAYRKSKESKVSRTLSEDEENSENSFPKLRKTSQKAMESDSDGNESDVESGLTIPENARNRTFTHSSLILFKPIDERLENSRLRAASEPSKERNSSLNFSVPVPESFLPEKSISQQIALGNFREAPVFKKSMSQEELRNGNLNIEGSKRATSHQFLREDSLDLPQPPPRSPTHQSLEPMQSFTV